MLFEFIPSFQKVQELLDHCRRIATNADVDSIDLEDFDIRAEGLAGECFGNTGEVTIAKTIALKEAFDFVDSHRRLYEVHGHDRGYYYSHADKELEIIKDRYDHLYAVIQRLDIRGDL